jgi:KDO2-lipid IV(A) lauroyltransferase
MTVLARQAEFYAARLLAGALGSLPRGPGGRLGALAGAAAHAAGARREIVRAQIAAAFPERDRAWVEDTAIGCYRHFGREAAEIVRLHRTGGGALPARMRTDEATEQCIERMLAGEGTILVTGHLGNWEVAAAYLAARGVQLAAVVKRQSNERFDEWIARSRCDVGIEPVYMDEARDVVPGLLAAGRSVALVADQDARSRGVVVPFLGRPASTFTGPARFALATGSALVFGLAVREGSGYRSYIEPVRAAAHPATADEESILSLTRQWVEKLDRHVRDRPRQYFWFHRRWKGQPDARAAGRNDSPVPTVPHSDPKQEQTT